MSFMLKKMDEILENNTHMLPNLQELFVALNRYIQFRKALPLLI